MKTAHGKSRHEKPSLKRPGRRIIAATLTVIYLIISLSPLAALAFQSKTVTRSLAGECVGDCRLCKCSPAASASNTCCCAKKRQQQSKLTKMASKSDCKEQPAKPDPPKKGSCCAKNGAVQQDTHETTQQQTSDSSQTETVYKCGCPCDSEKLFALSGFETKELLPLAMNEKTRPPPAETFYADLSHRLTSRQGEPPDPPPKITRLFL